MPWHREYAKQAYERDQRFYAKPQSRLFREHIWQRGVQCYALDNRMHDFAMWYQDEPEDLYREIYINKRTYRSAVRRAEVVVMKHGVRVREAEIAYRPSQKLLWELGKLDGLFRAVLRDKYLESSRSHFDHLHEHADYEREQYNMDIHRREGNSYTTVPYTETLWFQLRAFKLYWDSLLTKGEDVDVDNLLRFTSKTVVDIQQAMHDQQFHGSGHLLAGAQLVHREDVALLHEFAIIINTVEKEGLRMQVLGEIWSSGFDGVSFKLKDLYRTICGHIYEPRAAWLKKEGQLYRTYMEYVECVYGYVSRYERNMTQPYVQSEVVDQALRRLRGCLKLDYVQDAQDFVDVYDLWKLTVDRPNPPYVPPVAPAAQGWQPSWATGTQTQEMRVLLDGL
jgi:hypothetical protein